jgi:hypothetical protein
MVRAYKSERLDIPESARVVKAWFPTRESAMAELPKIRKHLEEGGETFTYPGHTHTKPPKGAEPEYIGEFAMSGRRARSVREAPCPCCWDCFRKFLGGMIAWFPQEQVIRLIGPDCFAARNPDGHIRAKKRYDDEQEAAKDRSHLLSQLPKLPRAINAILRAAEVGAALDAFRRDLHAGLDRMGLHLWTHVQDEGRLKVWGKVPSVVVKGERAGEVREFEDLIPYMSLRGYRMLAKDQPVFGGLLRACAARLQRYNFGEEWRASVDAMNNVEIRETTDIINATIIEAEDIIRKVNDLRRFAAPISINSLRRWGEHPGCPVKVHFASRLGRISFGKHAGVAETVDVPKNMFADVPVLEWRQSVSATRRARGPRARQSSGPPGVEGHP